ncbi:MAG: CBS domain-containing protein [Vicinamibacteria bacterium]
MKCSEVMTTEIVFSLPSESLDQVAKKMESADIGPVPIVEDQTNRKLIGMVTDRDLALRAVARGLDPKTTRAEEVMSRDIVTCNGNEDVQKALDLMGKHQVRRLPIADSDGRLVGIISQADVATRLGESEKTAEMVEEISEPRG